MGFFDLFGGGGNPADAAMPYLKQIPEQTEKYFKPFFESGTNSLPKLQTQYDQLLENPGAKMNQIGQNFQQSPGFQFALQQALQGANHAAAAGGMAGSPMHQQQNMQLATNLANQDYNNWLSGALGLYGGGLQGQQGMANMGQQAGSSMADMIAQSLAQQAQMAYMGQQHENQKSGAFMNMLGQLGGAALSAFMPGLGGLGALSAFMPTTADMNSRNLPAPNYFQSPARGF